MGKNVKRPEKTRKIKVFFKRKNSPTKPCSSCRVQTDQDELDYCGCGALICEKCQAETGHANH